MSHLRTKTETLACAWCGKIGAVLATGKVSPVAQSRGARVPVGWLHVYANLESDTSDVSYFVKADDGEGLGLHWVCSKACQEDSEDAITVAQEAYVESWDKASPRRQAQPKQSGLAP